MEWMVVFLSLRLRLVWLRRRRSYSVSIVLWVSLMVLPRDRSAELPLGASNLYWRYSRAWSETFLK